MKTIPSGRVGDELDYRIYSPRGGLMDVADITTVDYVVTDVTNSSTLRAQTALAVANTGTIVLDALDTTLLQGTRAVHRICITVNRGAGFNQSYDVEIVPSTCG